MRKELLKAFDLIYVLDLHGSSKRHETAPDGSKDENVFDIQQGVSINIFVKISKKAKDARVFHADLFGQRSDKYSFLTKSSFEKVSWKELSPTDPYFFFAPKDFSANAHAASGPTMNET